MDNVIGNLIYRITGDNTLLINALQKSKTAVQAAANDQDILSLATADAASETKELARATDQMTGSSGKASAALKAQKTQAKATATEFDRLSRSVMTFATKALTGVLIREVAEAGSRLEELENKFNTVFRGVEADANNWVEEYAAATNRGTIATREFLATQQDIRTGFGQTASEAASFSKALVAFTNDLASFTNVSVEETMAAMESVMAYQFEAGRRFGISLSVDIIEASEYAQALGKTWLEMDNLEKQEAVLSAAMAQSRNAIHQNITSWQEYDWTIGDAAVTSGSYVNTLTGFRQNLEDAAAALGTALLPTLSTFLSVGTDALRLFEALPEPIQAVATAAGVLGVALTTLGTGPVGLIVGGIGALLTLYGNLKDSQDDLAKSSDDLASATARYEAATKSLEGNTENLTTAQRALYEAQRDLARLEALSSLSDLNKEYTESTDRIREQEQAVQDAQAAMNAYAYASSHSLDEVADRVIRYQDLINANRGKGLDTSYLETYVLELDKAWSVMSIGSEDAAAELDKALLAANDSLLAARSAVSQTRADVQNAVLKVASAMSAGTLTAEDLEGLNEALAASALEMAVDITRSTEAIDGQTDAMTRAVRAGTAWRNNLAELRASEAEEAGDYERAAELRIALMEQERRASLESLASQLGLITEQENASELSEEILRERISSAEEGAEELAALEESYNMEIAALRAEAADRAAEDEQKLLDAREKNHQAYLNDLADLTAEEKERQAEVLFDQGEYEQAYAIRLAMLQEEHAAELAAFEELVEAEEASADDRALIEQTHAQEIVNFNREKEEAIAADRQKRAEEEKRLQEEADQRAREATEEEERRLATLQATHQRVSEQLINQAEAAREAIADELLEEGDIEGAFAIRAQLLEEEAARAEAAMQAQIDAGTATQQDLLDTQQYYANEEIALNEEKNQAIIEADEEARAEQIAGWQQAYNAIYSTAISLAGSIGDIYSAQTDAALQELEKQKEAQLNAIGEGTDAERQALEDEIEAAKQKGDFETAQEKQTELEKMRIEEEYDEKAKQLELEQAKREKQIAIFSATISMLQSMIGFLADPGSYAGIALSAMAAATGAAQIAAIAAQPLPSYAVGAVDVSEDHIAQVHQGEMIVPKTFAQGLRDGDLSLGDSGANVSITIINNTGEEVSTEESTTDDMREIKIVIGKAVEEQIANGRFDSSLKNRFGLARRGRNG